jgi:hypothetical protein
MAIVAGTLVLLAVLVATAGNVPPPIKDVHRTVPLRLDGRVEVETHKGSVRVSTWDRAEIDVVVRIEEDRGLFPELVTAADVRLDAQPDLVRLASRCRPAFPLGTCPLFHYTVRMPRTATLHVTDHKSVTEVDGLAALTLSTHKGVVRATNLRGPLRLTTHKGRAQIAFAAFVEDSRVETHKGSIDLVLPRASAFDMRTRLERKAALHSDFSADTGVEAWRGELLTAAVNGGGPALTLVSHKGELRLRAR